MNFKLEWRDALLLVFGRIFTIDQWYRSIINRIRRERARSATSIQVPMEDAYGKTNQGWGGGGFIGAIVDLVRPWVALCALCDEWGRSPFVPQGTEALSVRYKAWWKFRKSPPSVNVSTRCY